MIYHVLPGDAPVEAFKKTAIAGEVIVCRECLVVGDVDADSLPDFWQQRARFVLAEYGEDDILYHETVADELSRLLEMGAGDEVNLWFEYELFCSVNMWFCLWLLSDTAATVYRVEPAVLPEAERWNGFAKLDPAALRRCFEARTRFDPKDIALGSALWNAFRKDDHPRLKDLSDSNSPCFPYLSEVCEAAIERDTRPAEILAAIELEGKSGLDEVFPEFSKRGGVYGFADLQLQRLMEKS